MNFLYIRPDQCIDQSLVGKYRNNISDWQSVDIPVPAGRPAHYGDGKNDYYRNESKLRAGHHRHHRQVRINGFGPG